MRVESSFFESIMYQGSSPWKCYRASSRRVFVFCKLSFDWIQVMAGGGLTKEKVEELNEMRSKFGLSEASAQKIIKGAQNRQIIDNMNVSLLLESFCFYMHSRYCQNCLYIFSLFSERSISRGVMRYLTFFGTQSPAWACLRESGKSETIHGYWKTWAIYSYGFWFSLSKSAYNIFEQSAKSLFWNWMALHKHIYVPSIQKMITCFLNGIHDNHIVG